MKTRANLTSRYRIVVLSIFIAVFGFGSISIGWAKPSAQHDAGSLTRPAVRKLSASFVSPAAICLTPRPAMSSCSVDWPVGNVTQGQSTYGGISWFIDPEIQCDNGGDCSIDFIVADAVSSGGLTVTQYPSIYNNILAVSAVGASVGQHTLTVYYNADGDRGYSAGGCNSLSIYVESSGSLRVAQSAISVDTKTTKSARQR